MNSDKKMSAHFEARYRMFLLIFEDSDICGPDHEELKKILSGIDIIKYWCMCDEVNQLNGKYNINLFILLDIPLTRSYVQKLFSGAKIVTDLCSTMECIDFVRNYGVFSSEYISLPDTFEDSEFLTLEDLTSCTFEDSDLCSVELHSVKFMIFYDIVFLFSFSIFYFCGALGLAQKYLSEDFLLFGFTAGIVFLVADLIIMGEELWKRVKVEKLLARFRKKK